jgi:hypothetical protein
MRPLPVHVNGEGAAGDIRMARLTVNAWEVPEERQKEAIVTLPEGVYHEHIFPAGQPYEVAADGA